MTNLKRHWFLLIYATTIFSIGCSMPYTMNAPKQFKRFDDSKDFKYISADGVMLKAREVDNYPKASISFWKDATKEHLIRSGYTHTETTCFQTTTGLHGCTLSFALPHGAEDWIFQETIFVVKDILVLVEATGEFTKFKAIEPDLKKSLKTFSPNL